MKKILFISTLFSFLFLAFLSTLQAATVTIERDELDKILKRQDVLEKKVMKLQKKGGGKSVNKLNYLHADVEDISNRLDKIETKSILNKITIGGEYRTRLDCFQYDDWANPLTGVKNDSTVEEFWTNRLRLNLKSKISDNLIFHGRLSYFKAWSTSNDGLVPSFDMTYPSVPDADGNLHVERAYIDWFIPGSPFSFSFGRLPTSEGPPNELRDNTTRKGTWPNLVVNGEVDGIFANWALQELTGLENSMFRLAYVKLGQNYAEYQGIDMNGCRTATGTFEMEIPGIKDSLFWLSYSSIYSMPALSSIPAGYPMSVLSYPDQAGDLDIAALHLQVNNFKNNGIDLFFSFTYLDWSPNSQGTVLDNGLELGLWGDNASGNLGDSQDGYCYYTGIRYMLPFPALKNPSIGIEYNHGSKYWSGMLSGGSGDLINKLGINGDAYELYYIQPFYKDHMFCRLGVVHMDYEYLNPMLVYGSQQTSDMKITNLYLITDIKF